MSAKFAPRIAPKFSHRGNRISRHCGFTLVELLVVIGIIAILIGLLVTVIPKIRKAAWEASTKSQLSAISNAIQQYYGDYKAYPGPLANNQLGSAWDPAGVPSFSVNEPRYPQAQGYALTGVNATHITGAQNLVLGLLGGLQVQYNTNQTVSGFVYNPLNLFPDGSHPGPTGASSLNPNTPRRQQSYIQVKQGEISLPSNSASFVDAAGRSPTDAAIPVFLDKWPDPMPILYIRTNVGAKAIVGVRGYNDQGAQLIDPSAASFFQYTVTEIPQYDLCQVFDYTKSSFGTILNSKTPYHGLQGLGSQSLNPSNGTVDTISSGYANGGKNGVAYFRDPNYVANSSGTYDPLADNRHNGVAREKDGYILMAAGMDRTYGTSDDSIFPGQLQPAQ